MSEFTITIKGADRVMRRLQGLERKTARKVVRSALRTGAKIILKAAKQKVPVRTGALKRSLKVRAMKRSRQYIGVMVATSEGWFKGEQYYGGFVEFGTSRMAARPFVRPAYEENKEAVAKLISEEIVRGVEEAARGR